MEKSIIRHLYHHTLKEGTDIGKPSPETRAAVEALLKNVDPDTPEYGQQLDELLLAASAAEENGFVRGFICAYQLFSECTSE